MFWWRGTLQADDDHHTRHSVQVAFTQRLSGVSQGVWSGLNLGAHVGDDPGAVLQNRAAVAHACGLDADRVVYLNQVHEAEVAVVGTDLRGEPPRADAAVTTCTGVGLAVMVADCTPVLCADPAAGVVGVAHVGRPGLIAGVVSQLVTAMRAQGATELQAVVGPSVCARCYEVPASMRDDAAGIAPAAAARSWSGTPAIDVAAGAVEQLAHEGVSLRTWVAGCTREEDRLYSYRRDGQTGRFIGLIWMNAHAGE